MKLPSLLPFRRIRLHALYAAILLGAQAGAVACSLPVFRYALDRWPADAFRLQAPAAALEIEAIASDLRLDAGLRANLEALPADGAADQPAKLLFPLETDETFVLWSGALDAASYRTLTDSPARAEIARRLLAGESAVWVLVESGERAADEALAKEVGDAILAVEETAELPVIDPEDPTSRIGPGPKLKADFSVLRVSRSAAEEQVFLAMLAGPSGLDAFPKTHPFLAIVFGRGRVLDSWPADKVTAQLIQEASGFLLGACSCEVKHLNPGWDLLMRVNWDEELGKVEDARLASGEIAAVSVGVPKPETVTYQPAPAPAAGSSPPRISRLAAGTAGGVALLAASLFFVFKRRA